MITMSLAVETERPPAAAGRTGMRFGHLFSRTRDRLLKTVRGLAWRVMDIETEFEVLD